MRFLVYIIVCGLIPAMAVAQESSEEIPEFSVGVDASEETDDDESAEEVSGPVDGANAASSEDEDGYSVTTTLVSQKDLATIGGAAQRIDEEELEQLEYDNPGSIAKTVPGVFVRGEDGYGLRPNIGIRGANSDRSKKVTLMEDGILFGPAPYSAPAAYYFPIASRMTGVEVYKGPGAIKFGPNTIGGAMNWITRDIPYKFSGGLDLNAGSFATGKAHGWLGSSNEWGGVLFEGVHWQSDGFKELDGGGDTGFDRQEFMLKSRLNSDVSARLYHEFNLKIGYAREHSNETYLGLTDEDFRDQPYRRYRGSQLDEMNWERLQLQGDYVFMIGDDIDTRLTVYRNVFDRSWFRLNAFRGERDLSGILADPTARREIFYDVLRGTNSTSDQEALIMVDNDRSYVSQGVQLRTLWKYEGDWFANRLEAGVRVHADSIDRDHIETAFDMIDGDMVRDETPEDPRTRNEGNAFATAVWVLEQFSAWNFTVAPGARVEIIQTEFADELAGTTTEAEQVVFVPGIGVHYELVDNLGVLAGVHKGFSPVAPGQGEAVNPETSLNYELGVRYSDAERGRLLELVGFYNDYQNLLGDCSFSAGCSIDDLDDQFNAGAVDVYGVEAAGHWAIALAGGWELPTRLAYTFVQSEFKSAFTSFNPQYGTVEVGDELPYIPEHRGSIRLGVRNSDFALYTNVSYTGEMREQAGQGDEGLFTDDYVMVDLLTSYQVLEFLKVYAKAENVTMSEPLVSRLPFGARPGRPFLVQGGLKAEF